MLKTPIDLSLYEDITTEADIRSIKQFLDDKDSWENPTHYTILEYFTHDSNPDYTPRIYEITNLRITDIEAGVVICDGYLNADDVMLFGNLIDNGIVYGLSIFLVDDIIMISMDNEKITITMNTGYIQILY